MKLHALYSGYLFSSSNIFFMKMNTIFFAHPISFLYKKLLCGHFNVIISNFRTHLISKWLQKVNGFFSFEAHKTIWIYKLWTTVVVSIWWELPLWLQSIEERLLKKSEWRMPWNNSIPKKNACETSRDTQTDCKKKLRALLWWYLCRPFSPTSEEFFCC